MDGSFNITPPLDKACWCNLKQTNNNAVPELLETTGVSLKDFPISGSIVPEHPEYPEHWHNFHEIVIVLGGSARHRVGNEELLIHAGHVFVIPPKLKHTYLDTHRLSLINVCFLEDSAWSWKDILVGIPGYRALFVLEPNFRQVDSTNHMLQLTPSHLTTVEHLAKRVVAESRQRPEGYELMARAVLLELIGTLCRLSSSASPNHRGNPVRIEAALKFIEDHFKEEIDFSSLHRKFNFSRRNFYRLFKAGTGQSPMAYLQSVRLKEAARLLKEGEMMITQIAFEVGFNDSNHFSNRFRSVYGVSPSQYRNI